MTETTEYDAEGRVSARTDRSGVRRTMTYDHRGRPVGTHHPALPGRSPTSETQVYDAAGRLTRTIDHVGVVRETLYDVQSGQPVETRVGALGQTRMSSRTEYVNGRVSATVDAKLRRTAYTYDAFGARASVTHLSPSGGPTSVESWTYDALGRESTHTDADGRVTSRTYDAEGRLRTVNNAANETCTHRRWPVGRARGRAWRSGRTAKHGNQTSVQGLYAILNPTMFRPMTKGHDFESELAAASDEYTLEAPLHTLLGEAEDVAAFASAYWTAVPVDNEDGEAPRPGLEGAGPKLPRKIIGEIRALIELTSDANTQALLAVTAKDEDPYDRAQSLYDELSLALAFAFDDGVEDAKDAQLAALKAEHKDGPASADALALRLEQTAALAQKHEADLALIPAFETARIAEALAAAKALRATPGAAAGSNPERAAAYARRNKFLNLLAARVRSVRAAARYIFRNQPELVRLATSAHGRRVRAEARRAKKNKPAAPADA